MNRAGDAPWIADTVIIRNFLLIDRMDVLLELAGGSVFVPSEVLHPDDFSIATPAPLGPLGELGRGLWLYRERLNDPQLNETNRAVLADRLARFESLPDLMERGNIQVVELGDAELALFARLRDRKFLGSLGLKRLGAGEAACLAVAISRGWVLATDDSDALRALDSLAPGCVYRRTRQLLELAVGEGLLSCEDARSMHHSMVHRYGFWDDGTLSC